MSRSLRGATGAATRPRRLAARRLAENAWAAVGFSRLPRDPEVDVAQVALRSDELGSCDLRRSWLVACMKFGAGGVAAGAAVVDGRVPVGETDEKDGVERLGGLGVAEPDRFSSLFAAGTHPRSELLRVSRSSTITVSMKRCFPARRSCPPDFGAVIAAAAISFATWRTVSARRLS